MGRTKGPIIHWLCDKGVRAYPNVACNTVNPIKKWTENEDEVTCQMCKKVIASMRKKRERHDNK